MPTPSNLQFDSQVFDFAFHPKEDIIAAGLITGHIEWYVMCDFSFHIFCAFGLPPVAFDTTWKRMLKFGKSDLPKNQSEDWNSVMTAQVCID